MHANISTLSCTPTAILIYLNPQAALRYPLFCKCLPYHLEGQVCLCLCSPHRAMETRFPGFGAGGKKKNLRKKLMTSGLFCLGQGAYRLLTSSQSLALLGPVRAGNAPCPLLAGCVTCSLPYQKRCLFWKGHTFSQIQSLVTVVGMGS